MGLTKDHISLQTILRDVDKLVGNYSKIKYKGGNEDKIKHVVEEIKKYLLSKDYLMDDKINPNFNAEVEEIVFFLVINTEFECPLRRAECSPLSNMIPQLSKCVLTHVIIQLNLSEYYAHIIENLTIQCISELLTEMVPCLKKCNPQKQLEGTYIVVKALIERLSRSDIVKEKEETIDNINDAADELLKNLTGLQLDQSKNWKSAQIYQHMGNTLLKMFDLLLDCDADCCLKLRLMEKINSTCCSIIQNVTVNVYCSWAEIEEDGQSLQTIISWKAYAIVEKYQKHKSAKELIQMLSTIAKKPKTVSELIREADTETVIKMVDKITPDQRAWFRALLSTQVLKNKDALECATRWAHLADPEDVMLLLQQSINLDNPTAKKLVIKCSSLLATSEIITVLTRNLYKNGFNYVLNDNIEPQLMIVFNKMEGRISCGDSLIHEIILLILQHPYYVLTYLLGECIKNTFYTSCLKPLFSTIADLCAVSKFGLVTFAHTLDNIKPTERNYMCYVTLIKTLLEVNYFTSDTVFSDIIIPELKKLEEKEWYTNCNYLLKILNSLNLSLELNNKTEDTYVFLLHLLSDCRCYLLTFDTIKHDIANEVVSVINNTQKTQYISEEHPNIDTLSIFEKYYLDQLAGKDVINMLDYWCPGFNINDYSAAVGRLIQILPRCVLQEWIVISSQLINTVGVDKTVELITDVLILLCQLAITQERIQKETDAPHQVQIGVGYCLRCYGIVIKEEVQQFLSRSSHNIGKDRRLLFFINITKNICRVIKDIPKQNADNEGMSLINLLDEDSLKALAKNKSFVNLVTSFNNKTLRKVLAQKILNAQQE